MNIEPQRLRKFLLDSGLVTEEAFEKALKVSQKSKEKIEEVLISQGVMDREKLIRFEAYLLGVPFVNIEGETIPPEVLNLIPEQIARAHNIIAFRKRENVLEVVMLDPEDLMTIEFIKKKEPLLTVLPRLTTPESIRSALRQYQQSLDSQFGSILKEQAAGESGGESGDANLAKAAQELPIISIVDSFLNNAILQRASDVHIEPIEKEVIVRFRVDGILHDAMHLPSSSAMGIVARIKVLSNLKLDEHRLPQDGRFKIETDDYKYSVRVSVLPVFNGEKIVMRLLAENIKSQGLEDLGFVGKAFTDVKGNLARPTGMILITGPTGSGKTTTLYAMMEMLNTTEVNISTVEDPIEYRMPRINQTQTNAAIGLTFASGLRALVRQDPNIIMVGEIRDQETASLAVNAALTGHLVLSTIHTTEAAGTIPRLIDMKVEPFLIASTLNVIIAQRLVRKFKGEKEKYRLKQADLDNLAKYCDLARITEMLRAEKLLKPKGTLTDIELYRPKPSKDSSSGYKGRIGIFEVLPVTQEIKELIVSKASTKDISLAAKKGGMRTMVEDGFIKAVQGITSIEEVLRVIVE